MTPLIPDTTTDDRMAGLEAFLQHYLRPRRPEFGASADEVASIKMPAPLERFFRFAGRWPGQNPESPFVNRFCVQDQLCSITANKWASPLRFLDNRLVFVMENQGVWVAATERAGDDPPVWISEDCSHRETRQVWRPLEKPLSHFLVSFVLQELVMGSEVGAAAPGVMETFKRAGFPIEPVWIRGEYAYDCDRPSYFLVGDRILIRRALDEANGDDWYGCEDAAGAAVIASLGLPTKLE